MNATLLVVTNSVTALVGVAIGYIAARIMMSRNMKESKTMPEDDRKQKRRRFGRVDIILAILMVGFIYSTFISYNSNTNSNQAVDTAVAASKTALETSRQTQDLARCLEGYSNALADALQRRNDDNAVLQKADAARDIVVVELLMASVDPNQAARVPALSRALAEATKKKQEATEQVARGRMEKSYPEAPRQVC